MEDMLMLLAAPFAACVILTGIHCYLGIHVVMRQVIFVDLALAQIAALGAAAGTLVGYHPHSTPDYLFALAFTVLGAGVFSIGRFRDRRVPQEAIIGIVYAVSSAVAILILSKSAIGPEELEDMLVGRLLFVGWGEVGKTLAVYALVACVHVLFRKKFFAISASPEEAARSGINVRLWDFVFYVTFGIVVTSSVQMAGVLLVFSFLIVPAVCAMMLLRSVGPRLFAGWGISLLASAGGLGASALWDFPTGASVVGAFGVLFLACSLTYAIVARFRRRTDPGTVPATG